MNIGIVVPYFTPYVRGNEYGLARSLSDLGNNVTIITTTSRAPREKTIISNSKPLEESMYDFNVVYLPVRLDLGDNPITMGTDEFIRYQDIVLLQEDYPFICHDAFRAAKKYKIPTILSSERTYYPENIAKRKVLKLMDMTINKKLRNGVDILTAHCTAAKEFMANELDVRRKIEVICVGVDTQMFRPMPSQKKFLTRGNLKILTVARLHRYKGLNYLINAMKTVVEKLPDVHLYILGRGENEKNLKNLTEKLLLTSSVTFITTPIPNDKMPDLFAECDLYVQPSIIEPYGIAVLEAMACGKPVIGTNVGGMRDTIKDRETGYIVPAKDSMELADRIIRISSNDVLLVNLGKSARDRAVNLFDLKIIGYEYVRLSDNLASLRGE